MTVCRPMARFIRLARHTAPTGRDAAAPRGLRAGRKYLNAPARLVKLREDQKGVF